MELMDTDHSGQIDFKVFVIQLEFPIHQKIT